MIVLQIVLWALGAFAAYLTICFIVGFVSALMGELGLRRRPKFKVVRYEEGE